MAKNPSKITVGGTREETQRFAVFGKLVEHCGEMLTPGNVDRITAEIMAEIRTGGCAWAFGAGAMPPHVKIALRVLLEHVEPTWENCKAVVQDWLRQQNKQVP